MGKSIQVSIQSVFDRDSTPLNFKAKMTWGENGKVIFPGAKAISKQVGYIDSRHSGHINIHGHSLIVIDLEIYSQEDFSVLTKPIFIRSFLRSISDDNRFKIVSDNA